MAKTYNAWNDPSVTGGQTSGDLFDSQWEDDPIPQAQPAQGYTQDPSQIMNDPKLLEDIYKVYNSRGVYFNNNEEAIKRWYDDMVFSYANTAGTLFGSQGYFGVTEEQNEDIRSANNRLREAYYRLPMPWNEGGAGWQAAKSWGKGLATDPLNLVGLGWGAQAAKATWIGAKAMGTGGRSLAATRATKVGMGEGAIAAGIVGGQDVALQQADIELGIQDEYKLGRTGAAIGLGFTGGALLGSVMGYLGGRWTSKQAERGIEQLRGLGWSNDQIASIAKQSQQTYNPFVKGGERQTTKWFDAYVRNNVTPADHINMKTGQRPNLGEFEPGGEAAGFLDKPVLDIEEVLPTAASRISEAAQNINILSSSGADSSPYIVQRDYWQAIRRAARTVSARRSEAITPEQIAEVDVLEEALVEAANNASAYAYVLEEVRNPALREILGIGIPKEREGPPSGGPTVKGDEADALSEARAKAEAAGKPPEMTLHEWETGGGGKASVESLIESTARGELSPQEAILRVQENESLGYEDAYRLFFSKLTPEQATTIEATIRGEGPEVPVTDTVLKNTLDKSKHLDDDVVTFAEGAIDNYDTIRLRGPKAVLSKVAETLNRDHGATINKKQPTADLASDVSKEVAKAKAKVEEENLSGAADLLLSEVENILTPRLSEGFTFEDALASPKVRGPLAEAIRNVASHMDDKLPADSTLPKGSWGKAGEILIARLEKDYPATGKPKIDVGKKMAISNKLDDAINSLPRKARAGVRRRIEASHARFEKMRNTFKGVEDGAALGRLVSAAEKMVLKIYDKDESFLKSSLMDLEGSDLDLYLDLTKFRNNAKKNKGDWIFKDPIFTKAKNRAAMNEVEAISQRLETKGGATGVLGRLASGVGVEPARGRAPRGALPVRKDWNGQGTGGFEAARATAETSGSTSPVPFVAVRREKVTSKPKRVLDKDGNARWRTDYAKKGSKLWYDPIGRKVWKDKDYNEMLVARGERESGSLVDDAATEALERVRPKAAGHKPTEQAIDDLIARINNLDPETIRNRGLAAAVDESDTPARIPAILRRTPSPQGKQNPRGFLASYFRTPSEKQARHEDMLGANDNPNDWVNGTVSAKYKGAGTSPEAVMDFIPDSPRDAHVLDRYKVSGFDHPIKDGVAPKTYNLVRFRDVADEEIDLNNIPQAHRELVVKLVSELVEGHKGAPERAYFGIPETVDFGPFSIPAITRDEARALIDNKGKITVRALQILILRRESEWPDEIEAIFPAVLQGLEEGQAVPLPELLTPEGMASDIPQDPVLAGIGFQATYVSASPQDHVDSLIALYQIRNQMFPGGITYDNVTRQRSLEMIEKAFTDNPRTGKAVMEVMDYLTRGRPMGPTLRNFNKETMRVESGAGGGEVSIGTYSPHDMNAALNERSYPRNPGEFDPAEGYQTDIGLDRERMRAGYFPNTEFYTTAHEIMHWAYKNLLNDNEKLAYWEKVVLPKGAERMAEEGSGYRQSDFPEVGTNIGDSPEEYFANMGAMYIESKMPGALEENYWISVIKKTHDSLANIGRMIGFRKSMVNDDLIDGTVIQILQRVLPDEFKTHLAKTTGAQVGADLRKFRYNYGIKPGHAESLASRAWAFSEILERLREASSGDLAQSDDVLISSARDLAAHLLDASHEQLLGSAMHRSMIALSRRLVEAADGKYDVLNPSETSWGSAGTKHSPEASERIMESSDDNFFTESIYDDQGVLHVDADDRFVHDMYGTVHIDELTEAEIIGMDGYVTNHGDFAEAIGEALPTGIDRALPLGEDGVYRTATGRVIDEYEYAAMADDQLQYDVIPDSMTTENLRTILELDDTKNVLDTYESLLAKRWQNISNIETNGQWENAIPPSFQRHYDIDDAGNALQTTTERYGINKVRRTQAKEGKLHRQRRSIHGYTGGTAEVRDKEMSELLTMAMNEDIPLRDRRDAMHEIQAQIAEGRKPAQVDVPTEITKMRVDDLVAELGRIYPEGLRDENKLRLAQIKTEIIRRGQSWLKKNKGGNPGISRSMTIVRREVIDSGTQGVMDGIPENVRPHLREILSRLSERTPEKTYDTRLVTYRIMNMANLTDRRQPIRNEGIYRLAGEDLDTSPNASLTDYSDPGFQSLRSQIRTAVKEGDADALAKFALRAGVLTDQELSAIRTSFKDIDAFLERWSSYAKNARNPLRGVSDESLNNIEGAMESITANVAYIMDGVDSLTKLYKSHPKLKEFADPFSYHRAETGKDLSIRLENRTSIPESIAGAYAKDYIRGMSLRAKHNLQAFVGDGYARTNDGAIPYFMRSEGSSTAMIREDGDFGHGVYASESPSAHPNSLVDTVVRDARLDEVPTEKISELETLASSLSRVRKQVATARAAAETDALNDTGLDKLLATEARLSDELKDKTGRVYGNVVPVVFNGKRYADFSMVSNNSPNDWLVREFFRRVQREGDGISIPASGNLFDAINHSGIDRGRALYTAMWKTLANGATANESAAKAKVNSILTEMGYDGIKFTGSHNNHGGGKQAHTEMLIFDADGVRAINDPRFEQDDALMFAANESGDSAVSPLMRAMLNGDNVKNVSVAHTVERGSSSPSTTKLLNATRDSRPLSPEDQIEAYKSGPTFYLRKGSRRLRMLGDRYVSDFLQREEGTGIFETINSEIGRKLMPIVRALNAMPGSGNSISRWFKKSIDLREHGRFSAKPTDSEKRLLWALRTGEETGLADSVEMAAYRRVRDVFSGELEAMKTYGIMDSGIEQNYVPQIWRASALSRNMDRATEKLAEYFMHESVGRASPITQERGREIARNMIHRIIDEDGVHFPPEYAVRNEPGLDHVDYSRLIKLHLPENRYHLMQLEEFLENDIGAMLAKYLDGSTRKIEFAKRFGAGNHGLMTYLKVLEEGKSAALRSLMTPRVIRRTRRGITMEGEVREMKMEREIPSPFEKNEIGAQNMLSNVMDALSNPKRGGVVEAEQILKNAHTYPLPPKQKFQWDRRAESMVAGLEMGIRGNKLPPSEINLMEDLIMSSQRKPFGTGSYTHSKMRSLSKFMRNFTALTYLGFTTLTSLTDVALPLIRSGEMTSYIKGMARFATDPDYREMMRETGLSIENYVHNRLVGMYGVDASKLATGFFNATLLTPWTDRMREMAGIVGYEWFKTEQRRIARHGLNSNAGRKAKKVLERYGLGAYARPDGPSLDSLMVSRKHMGIDHDAAIDPEMAIRSQDLKEALIKFANDTIYAPNTNDIPLWAQSPVGAMMWQLKSFPMMMSRMGKDVLMDAYRDPIHHSKPLMMYMLAGPASGAMALAAKDTIQMRAGEDEGLLRTRNAESVKAFTQMVGYDPDIHGDKDDFVGWYFEGLLHMGGLGLYLEVLHDLVQQADNGYFGLSRAAGTVGGPAVSQAIGAWNVVQGLHKTILGATSEEQATGGVGTQRQAVRELAQRVPVLGGIRALKETLVDAALPVSETGSRRSTGRGGGRGSTGR